MREIIELFSLDVKQRWVKNIFRREIIVENSPRLRHLALADVIIYGHQKLNVDKFRSW